MGSVAAQKKQRLVFLDQFTESGYMHKMRYEIMCPGKYFFEVKKNPYL